MSANHRNYEDYLEYFPEKEKRALEKAKFVENEIDEAAIETIKQLNRSKLGESLA